MEWLLIVSAGWLLLAVLTALVLGRAIHLADRKAEHGGRSASGKPAGSEADKHQLGRTHLRAVAPDRPTSERVPSEPTSPLP